MENKGHLHLHTRASDGLIELEDIIEAGISFTAITDHDTMQGIEKFKALEKQGIEIIPGIELSARHMGKNIHMLVYYPYYKPEFLGMLDSYRQTRLDRALKIASNLRANGIKISDDLIIAEKGLVSKGNVAHIALSYEENRQMLASKGIFDEDQFIDAYLQEGKPGHFKLTGMEVSELVKMVNGVKALAHPAHNLDMGAHDYIVEDLARNYGFWGIEVWTRRHEKNAPEYYLALSRQLGLYPLISNDVHRKSQINDNLADYRIIEEIKKEKK